MRRSVVLLAGAVAVLAAAFALLLSGRPAPGEGGTVTVTWRGERFELPKAAPEYDEAQAARIARVLRAETPPARVPSFQALLDYHRTLVVPGYGESTGGFGDETPLGRFTFLSVQLPRSEQHRVLVYRREGEGYRHVDDFLYEGRYPPSLTFKADHGRLLYLEDLSRRVIRIR